MRILVVDDEPVVAQTLGLILKQAGYEVESFTQPGVALASLREKPAELVLTDMCMPEMDGVELALKVSDYWPKCHVIILSGKRPLVQPGRPGFDWSPYEILYKPLDPRDLLSIVARVGRAAA